MSRTLLFALGTPKYSILPYFSPNDTAYWYMSPLQANWLEWFESGKERCIENGGEQLEATQPMCREKKSKMLHSTQLSPYSQITAIACGWNHLLILEQGCIVPIGYNSCGNLGLDNTFLSYGVVIPQGMLWDQDVSGRAKSPFEMLQEDESTKVTRIWCGMNFSFAQTSDGMLWATGWNNQKQLGLPTQVQQVPQWTPVPVHEWNTTSLHWDLKNLAAGAMHTWFLFEERTQSASHSCIICDEKHPHRQDLFFAGSNTEGQRGIGPLTGDSLMGRVMLPLMQQHVVCDIVSADEHSFILTHCGLVFACGSSPCLGVCHRITSSSSLFDDSVDPDSWASTRSLKTIFQVTFPSNECIVKMSTGDKLALFLAASGRVYVTGVKACPVEVTLPTSAPIVHFAADSDAFALADDRDQIFYCKHPREMRFQQIDLDSLLTDEQRQRGVSIKDFGVADLRFERDLLFILLREKGNVLQTQLEICRSRGVFTDVHVQT